MKSTYTDQSPLVLSQQKTIKELLFKLDNCNIKTEQFRHSRDKYKNRCNQLQRELDALRGQLQQEQQGCKTRHLNFQKYKLKNQKLKQKVEELELYIKKMQIQDFNNKINYENEINKKINEEMKIEIASLNKQLIQRESQMSCKIEIYKKYEEEINALKQQNQEAHKKIIQISKEKQIIIQINQKTCLELQQNLERILIKVKLLQNENNDLKQQCALACQQIRLQEQQLLEFKFQLRSASTRRRKESSSHWSYQSDDQE